MSCSLLTVLVDLDLLRACFDPAARPSWPRGLKRDDLARLKRLRSGEPLPADDDPSDYHYALVKLAQALGQPFEVPEAQDVRGFPLQELVPWMANGAPVPLPANDSFPYLGYLAKADLPAVIAAAEEALEEAGPRDAEAYEGLLALYDAAVRADRDLFAAYY